MPATAAQPAPTGVGFETCQDAVSLHNRLLQRANLLLAVRAKTINFRFHRAKHSQDECPDNSNPGQAQQYDDRPARKPRNFFSGYAHQSPITTLQAGDIITVLSVLSQVQTDTVRNGCLMICHKWLAPPRKKAGHAETVTLPANAAQRNKSAMIATGVSSSTARIFALSLIIQKTSRRTSAGFLNDFQKTCKIK